MIFRLALCMLGLAFAHPAFSQSMFDEKTGYKFAYDAFCSGNDGKIKNAHTLMKGGQLSPTSFAEARLNSMTECPRLIFGLPQFTFEAVDLIRDPKRVFVVPGEVQSLAGPTLASNQFMQMNYTKLAWIAKRKNKLADVKAQIQAGADVNWRNSLQLPIVYYAVQRGDSALLKALLDAGADPSAELPKFIWAEKMIDVVSPDFLVQSGIQTAYGTYSRTTLKEGYAGSALLEAYRAKGQTHSLLDYASSSCTEFRSPHCWELLNVLLDAGAKPSHGFIHNFFRPHRFNIFPKFPEYKSGMDRLIASGASLNAPDEKGRTVLARVLEMNVPPETLQYLLGLGAKTVAEAASPPKRAEPALKPSPQPSPGTADVQTPVAARAPSAPPPIGSRVATAGINVREQPALDGTLMGTLGAGSVFNIEKRSPDGQWSLVDSPPVVRGWASNAVILKSSTANSPTAEAD